MTFTCPTCGAVIELMTPQPGDDVRIHHRQEPDGRVWHSGSIVTPPLGRFQMSYPREEKA